MSSYDGLGDKLREFIAETPNLEPMDVLIEALNFAGSQDPVQLLRESNEPSLQRETSPEFEAYRFYCFGHRAHPSRIIRVERDKGTCHLVAKIWEGLTEANEDIWQIAVNRAIDESEFHEIASRLALADFWNTRHCVVESPPLNAVSLMIEGRKGSSYRSVNRSGYFSTGLRAAFESADRLAGFGETDQ